MSFENLRLLLNIFMHVNYIHSFDLKKSQMKEIQFQLAKNIQIIPYTSMPKTVCGVDLAYFDNQAVAVIVVMDFATRQTIETVYHVDHISYDYVPGLLAFREIPIFLKAWEKMQSNPDIVFFDGNGILHPNRVGIATHASFFIDKPTIGIAKTHFIGSYQELNKAKGSYENIYDGDEVIGAVLRTQTNVKPVFVSVGNRVTLQNALDFTMHFIGKESRIPEIIRQADLWTRKLRQAILQDKSV
ncbi:endonuclease V [Thermoflavimicrobium daqui]|nr:endonuclease V [Thermoflavimicrobium daqui]